MLEILKKYWGYSSFRPFQEEIIQTVMQKRDTLSILPTGGGKSLCFQLPALLQEGMTVVISPLIALMKDQVDGLKEMGIPADYLNSSLTAEEQRNVIERVRAKELKLLYLAPERLKIESTMELLQLVPLSFFVVDEAHCISEWGHDFRDDYRQLKIIKQNFNDIPVHAFTATATPEVQGDIVKMLGLQKPKISIGPVDRANLTFRLIPRSNLMQQVTKVLESHSNEPGIIYCLRRADVDELSEELNTKGHKNVPYHAGLSDETRRKNHEKFTLEKVDIVVATIAFGMGIDRSNIRFVVHAAMPKNIEQYQQETGRGGRDGLSSSCYLFYGGGDYHTWSRILSDSKHQAVMTEKLKAIYRFCVQPQCRHKGLVHYFGQTYQPASCQACDYCLGEVETVQEPLIMAQKILSCVMRAEQHFGADHIARILKGDGSENITRWGHQKLSTFGLLQENPISFIRSMIDQLLGQNFLERNPEFQTLSVTPLGWQVLRNEVTPVLAKPALTAKKKKEITRRQKQLSEAEWGNIDQNLFGVLRRKRTELATQKGVPAYFIFSDKTLQEMARLKPVTEKVFATLYGVGEQKQKAYAKLFIDVIAKYIG